MFHFIGLDIRKKLLNNIDKKITIMEIQKTKKTKILENVFGIKCIKKEILKKICSYIYIYECAYYNMFFYVEIQN